MNPRTPWVDPRPAAPQAQDERSDILIVDDLPEKLLVFATVLEELKQNLIFVRSGKDALREVLQREFAVILLDVNMPELDGFETAAMIRQYHKSAHTPIIFITSYADEMQTARGYSLGAVDYILSPVVPEVLRSKVRVFVSLHAMRRQVRRQADDRAAMMAAEAARLVAEENDRRSAFLAQASQLLGGSLDIEVGVEQLARLAVPRLSPLALVQLAGEDGTSATALVAAGHQPGAEPELRKVRVSDLAPLVQSALRIAVRDRMRHTVEVAARAPLTEAALGLGSDRLAALPVHALTAVPLLSGQRIVGALLAADWGELDWQALEDLAGRAARAFDNARLYHSLQTEIVERRAAEAKLQLASQRKDEFLAMLSHELRNPLAAIHAALEVVRRTSTPEPRLSWAAEIMHRQLGQMTRLIEELLDVARISQNKIVLMRERVDLNGVVAQSVEAAQPFVGEREQILDVHLPPEPVWVQGDFARLTQIVSNLLHNASKYSGKGTRIELHCSASAGRARIAVRDHGIGIDAELLPRIFDLFAQGARGLDRAQGGLGVGLTLAMRLTQLHGGSLEAISEGPNRGSEFRVQLPCMGAAPVHDRISPTRSEPPKSPSRRVLVVDDNRDAARSMAVLLELHGHQVRTASDGRQALDCAESFRPEVVILDIGLPLLDGYEVARRLRALPQHENLLLLALTGYGQQEDCDAAREAGFDHHFVKPADPASVVACIDSHAAAPATPALPQPRGN